MVTGPDFGNCFGKENTLGELVRHQSKIPVSLVNTLTICVRPHIRLNGAGEISDTQDAPTSTSRLLPGHDYKDRYCPGRFHRGDSI